MKKASSGALLAAVAFTALAATAVATNYTVGGSDLWDTYIDYDKWTAGKTFVVGDTLGACLLLATSILHPCQSIDQQITSSVKNQ